MKVLPLILVSMLSILLPMQAKADDALRIGIQCYNEECRIPELENILAEAYARIGRKVAFEYYPAMRTILEASEQTIDGIGLITRTAAENTPELIRVKSPFSKATLVAFTRHGKRTIRSLKDLEGLTVGTIRGSILLREDTLDGLRIRRHRFNEARHAFAMLKEGRLDAILGGATAGMLLARHMKIKVIVSPPLLTEFLYHAVARKHAALVPGLEKAISEMTEDGTLRTLLGKYQRMMPWPEQE